MNAREWIASGRGVLGIEFGSTRIKAVLIGEDTKPIASGSHSWENQLENGIWTYSEEAIRTGLQACYADLKRDVQDRYGIPLRQLGGIGLSAMMHGYLAFDAAYRLLVPFRTWRNTMTAPAAEALTDLFQFNIPQRWSIAHLYQAILNDEPHVPQLRHLNTLAGWATYWLTGAWVLGTGDAAGVMPLDEQGQYHPMMLRQFDELIAPRQLPWHLAELLPRIQPAGAIAGYLTQEGAALLDPTGELQAGAPVCPPEGDAGTGMTATNSVAPRTGNVSAGTSVFAMVVLEHGLKKLHPEIDLVTTPTGKPVAMVHCNSCTSDLNAWVQLFAEFARLRGEAVDMNELYTQLFRIALEGEKDGGGLVAFNYYSGEPVTGLTEGRPLLTRLPDARLTLANLMRTHLYASLATLKLGMGLLREEEVRIDSLVGHGGLFKTPVVGQSILAAAMEAPVTVMETAGEGGAWGMALLADYMVRGGDRSLEDYLSQEVFTDVQQRTLAPDPEDVAGFRAYLARYVACLPAEKAAVAGL